MYWRSLTVTVEQFLLPRDLQLPLILFPSLIRFSRQFCELLIFPINFLFVYISQISYFAYDQKPVTGTSTLFPSLSAHRYTLFPSLAIGKSFFPQAKCTLTLPLRKPDDTQLSSRASALSSPRLLCLPCPTPIPSQLTGIP